MKEFVILVDENDNKLGSMEKQSAHIAGLLHRAFSIFIFNSEGELLIQQRAKNKYHSPSLWTNTCCSHPRDNETYKSAAHRRLKEEMGFDCDLEFKFSFIYKAKLDNNLTEHELDQVFVGSYNGEINFNPNEVKDYRWIKINNLREDVANHPELYTVWFKIILDRYISHIEG